jgi:peptidoglycan L-alanyl-D-glutamate endopeptidase CwlK
MISQTPIIDSNYSRSEALEGLEIPSDVEQSLVVIPILHYGFDARVHQGQLVIHEALAEEVSSIFTNLLEDQYPIEKILPVVAYHWDDEASMQDNNSSAFNYRAIFGTTTLSNHSLGRAIDINPWFNPYYTRDGTIIPVGSHYYRHIPYRSVF